ncbi:hypothetical protein ABIA39_006112 [Nocardia sp. GAS34]|uniref:sensor histidine kinase n=1 Tax=unclassified Nocardia TaxID=2637762 RepID=UPI003D24ABC6
MTQAIEALLALRIVQPTLEAFRSNIFKEYPAAFRGAQHDPDLDRYFVAVAAADTTRHFKRWALFDVCCALTTQGIAFADLTPEAFLHYARTTREAAMAAYSISTYVGHLDGDPELLAQAVRNLVENALRHGLGTPVEVRVTATRVQVRDHGPGVPPQDRTRVFERRVTGAASTGTGLAIVAWVAGLHGGTARISQAPGGASVELLLPERAGR